MRPLLLRLLSPRGAALAAAGLVTLAGVVLVLLGLARATVWAPESVTVARVTGQPGVPLVVTTPALTTLDGPSLQVDVRGPAERQVFVGVGRADDVAAYLQDAARTEVTGAQDGKGEVRRAGTQPTLPEPAGVDVWAAGATGPGRAGLTWQQQPGRWQVVAAVDGATPPDEVVLTWQRARVASPAPALLAVGGLLLVLGLVGGWAARRRLSPRDAAPAPAAVPPAPTAAAVPTAAAAADTAAAPARVPAAGPAAPPAAAPGTPLPTRRSRRTAGAVPLDQWDDARRARRSGRDDDRQDDRQEDRREDRPADRPADRPDVWYDGGSGGRRQGWFDARHDEGPDDGGDEPDDAPPPAPFRQSPGGPW